MGEQNTVPMRINKVEGAAGQVKVSGGPGVLESWGAAGGAATMEFLVQAVLQGGATTDSSEEGIAIDGGGKAGNAKWIIPQDYSSLTSVEAIFIPKATGANMKYSIYTDWGAYNGGEQFDVHTEINLNVDMGATTNEQNLNVDISGYLDVAAMAVGDLVSVRVIYSATAIASNFYFRGVRFKYS